jgi:hypothetical protein
MKKILMIVFLGLSIGSFGQALTKEALIEREMGRFKSMIAANGAELDDVLHADLVYNHSSGATDNKTTYVANIVNKKSIYYKINVEEMVARIYGNIGIINGVAGFIDLKDGKELPPNRLRFTDIWVNENGKWRMVSWQSTKAPKE